MADPTMGQVYSKTKKFLGRTKTKTYDQSNFKPGMAAVVYSKSTKPILKQKVVETKKKKKVIDYGPIDYYDNQTKIKNVYKK